MDGKTEQGNEAEEKEGGSGKNKDISRYDGDVATHTHTFITLLILPPHSSPYLLPPPVFPVTVICLLMIWFAFMTSDNAYSCDPRVKQFKEQEKAEKEAKKKAKREAARQEALERERVRCSLCFSNHESVTVRWSINYMLQIILESTISWLS